MKRVFLSALALVLTSGAAAQASQVYFNDFESGSTLSGTGSIVGVQGYEGANDISGSFWRDDTKVGASDLSLSGLGSHSSLVIEFDLALIDSWDGGQDSSFGPDFFNVTVDGEEALRTSNVNPISPLLTDGVFGDFGFNSTFSDVAYRVSLVVDHILGGAEISFFADGGGYQGGIDESWAIDNLSVSTSGDPSVIPLPAGLPLLLGALGLTGLTLRKRKSS